MDTRSSKKQIKAAVSSLYDIQTRRNKHAHPPGRREEGVRAPDRRL